MALGWISVFCGGCTIDFCVSTRFDDRFCVHTMNGERIGRRTMVFEDMWQFALGFGLHHDRLK